MSDYGPDIPDDELCPFCKQDTKVKSKTESFACEHCGNEVQITYAHDGEVNGVDYWDVWLERSRDERGWVIGVKKK